MEPTKVWDLGLNGSFQNKALLLSLEGAGSVQHHVTALHGRQYGLQVVPVDDSVLQAPKFRPVLHSCIIPLLAASAQYDRQIGVCLDE